VKNNPSTTVGPERRGPLPVVGVVSSVVLTPGQAAVADALEEAAEPVTLAALAASMNLHPNTVREHLVALEAEGLVSRGRGAPSGRGRPADRYQLANPPGTAQTGEYAALAATLAATLHRHPEPAAEAVRGGQAWGERLASELPAPAGRGRGRLRAGVVALLDRLHFSPEADRDATLIRLTRCPLLDAARQYPDVVCSVHEGIIRGALQHWGDPDPRPQLLPFAEPGACVLLLGRPRGRATA